MSSGYLGALEEAKNELEASQLSIAQLLARKQVLERLVSQLEEVIGERKKEDVSNANAVDLSALAELHRNTAESRYLWQYIRECMNGGEVWTLTEAGRALEVRFGMKLGPNRPQKIRNAVVRHPETFEQLADGRYRVRPKDQGATEAAP